MLFDASVIKVASFGHFLECFAYTLKTFDCQANGMIAISLWQVTGVICMGRVRSPKFLLLAHKARKA